MHHVDRVVKRAIAAFFFQTFSNMKTCNVISAITYKIMTHNNFTDNSYLYVKPMLYSLIVHKVYFPVILRIT